MQQHSYLLPYILLSPEAQKQKKSNLLNRPSNSTLYFFRHTFSFFAFFHCLCHHHYPTLPPSLLFIPFSISFQWGGTLSPLLFFSYIASLLLCRWLYLLSLLFPFAIKTKGKVNVKIVSAQNNILPGNYQNTYISTYARTYWRRDIVFTYLLICQYAIFFFLSHDRGTHSEKARERAEYVLWECKR